MVQAGSCGPLAPQRARLTRVSQFCTRRRRFATLAEYGNLMKRPNAALYREFFTLIDVVDAEVVGPDLQPI